MAVGGNKIKQENGSFIKLTDLCGMATRIPPSVATIDFQYPSFLHRMYDCDTKWKSFRDGQFAKVFANFKDFPGELLVSEDTRSEIQIPEVFQDS